MLTIKNKMGFMNFRSYSKRNPISLSQVAALAHVENFQAPLKKERAICPLFKFKIQTWSERHQETEVRCVIVSSSSICTFE